MLKKFASVVVITAIVITLSATSALAHNSSDPIAKTNTGPVDVTSGVPARKEVEPNEPLKNSLLKLIADAKAGKVLPDPKSQIQPAKSNNWSKGTTIAVGVGVAVAVVVVILVAKHKVDNSLGGLGRL